MNINFTQKHALLGLRIGIGLIFLYFGLHAFIDPANQALWLSSWVKNLLFFGVTPAIYIMGALQLLTSASLLTGYKTKYGGYLGAFLLLGIVINLGFNEIAYRDACLLLACLVIATSSKN